MNVNEAINRTATARVAQEKYRHEVLIPQQIDQITRDIEIRASNGITCVYVDGGMYDETRQHFTALGYDTCARFVDWSLKPVKQEPTQKKILLVTVFWRLVMTNKTLADLLREDDAKDGDVYEACGKQWRLEDGTLVTGNWDYYFARHHRNHMPAEGWKRVSPRMPLRVEFAATVYSDTWNGGYYLVVPGVQGEPLAGKRVRVIVESINDD
jgi:hypothetical protein